jgi:hypothetical protein
MDKHQRGASFSKEAEHWQYNSKIMDLKLDAIKHEVDFDLFCQIDSFILFGFSKLNRSKPDLSIRAFVKVDS